MTVLHVPIGQAVTIHLEFRDKTGALANPSAGNLKVRDPAGNITTTALASLTHPSTGIYELDVTANLVGRWNWYGNSTAGLVAANQGYFVCDAVEWAAEYP